MVVQAVSVDSNRRSVPNWAWPFVGMAALLAALAVIALPCLVCALIWGQEMAVMGVMFWAVVAFGGFLGLEMREW